MIASVTVSPHQGFPAMAHSGAARAAVEAMTRDWAARWEADGISAVALALGRFDTESLRKYPEELTRGAARSVPLGRLGEPREFGWLAALVASPLGRALSGSTITLDGAADDWWGPWPPPALTGAERQRADRGAPRRLACERYPPRQGVRAKCCGCTEAFQASRAGSIPVARLSATGSGAVW